MKCKTALAKLTALMDGELTETDAARVRDHLAHCAACSATAAETTRVQEMAAAWITTGSDVWEEVRAEMEIETPDSRMLLAAVRALEAEVRSLREEVAGLRARADWHEHRSDFFGPIGRSAEPVPSRLCLRIV